MLGSKDPILSFFIRAGKLKKELRKGWIVKARIEEAESVADHTFRTALMAMVLGDYLALDTCKILRMALIHDLPEAILGDTMPEEKDEEMKKGEENKAFEDIISSLEPRIRELYKRIWEEFETQLSKESRLLKEIDELEMAVQAAEYINSGVNPELLQPFFDSAGRRVKEPRLARLLDSLRGNLRDPGQ